MSMVWLIISYCNYIKLCIKSFMKFFCIDVDECQMQTEAANKID